MRIRFGACVLDTAVRQLYRGAQLIPLSPKAFRLLEVLAERRPRAVPQAELRRLLWPDTVAGGTTLARLVHEVRRALDDRSRKLVRTVHRFGYAFGSAASEAAPSAHPPASAYALRWGARHIPLPAGEHIIGRAPEALVSLASAKVSRQHARLVVIEQGVTVEDLGSKNGTRVGNRRIDGPVPLRHGDRLMVGPILLILRASRDESTTSAQGTSH